jgi:hypothetical protein
MTPNLTGQVPGQKPVRRLNNRYQPNAQSAVLVKKDGVEYAIVSDDNYAHLDPYWRAMYDSWKPYYYSPTAPFITKKVAVGGKLGIIKDPFGTAEYLGATLPYDGYGIVNLSLSEDGKVLLGQFKGGYSGNLFSPYAGMPLPSTNAAWNVDNLLDAALAQPAEDRLSKHINLPPDTLLSVPTHPGQPIGTYFDDALPAMNVEGRMGDIIEVDLKRLVAQSLGMQDLLISNGLKDFELDGADVFVYADDYTSADANTPFTLVTVAGEQNHDLYSRNGAQTADFATTGRMYLAPKLTADDLTLLRNGERISVDKSATLNFSFKMKDANGDWITKHTSVKVTAKDIAALNTFFGDRSLDNPGYSEFELTGGVGRNATNDVLDVYRVEQRLAYLGFPVFGQSSGVVSGQGYTLNVPMEFIVDGQFGSNEEQALRGFYAATHYQYNRGSNSNGIQTATRPEAKTVTQQVSGAGAADDTNWEWLNAYNAPHWVNVYKALDIPTVKGSYQHGSALGANFKDGTDSTMEIYSTSWTLDLLKAWEASKPTLVSMGLVSNTTKLQLNGLTDPAYGFPSHGKGGHSVGMGIDLGVHQDIFPRPRGDVNNDGVTPATITGTGLWNVQNALDWTASPNLPNSQGNRQQDALRSFLSLYAVTQSNFDTIRGIWGDLSFSNNVRSGLFGSGAQNDQQMIQNVWIGDAPYTDRNGNPQPLDDNPYTAINAILEKLGFVDANGLNHGQQNDHHNHFHVDLRAPVRVDLPENLLADNVTSEQATAVADESPITRAQVLLDQVKTDLNLTQGDVLMFVADMPNVPPQELPVMIAQASQAQTEDANTVRTLGVCFPVPNRNFSAENGVIPKGDAAYYLRSYENKSVAGSAPGTIAILEQPKHGILRLVTQADVGTILPSGGDSVDPAAGLYFYLPENGYVGDDKAAFLVEIAGVKIKVIYFLQAIEGGTLGNTGVEEACAKTGTEWKISTIIDANGNSTITAIHSYSPLALSNTQTLDMDVLAPWLGTLQLDGYLSSGLDVTTAPLATGAVGQTTGNTITLDNNANGYGWYIDLTPGLNEEFLPTSNPYEWVAKPGSEAEGKMDLLTVLLHEAAHSLGLDHTADAHALMAPTLQPGVRRLPSPELLAELQRGSNDDLLADGRVGTSFVPTRNPEPNAPLPLGLGFTAFWAGRMRKSGYGYALESLNGAGTPVNVGWVSDSVTQQFASNVGLRGKPLTQPTQYEVVPNPTLINSEFAGNSGWNTTGQVTFGSNAAVLTESPVAQTRLNQLFTLGDNDRFLRFTLDNVNASPDDAIEVALINTNTGSVIRD